MSSSLRSCQPRRLHVVLAAALLAVGLLTPALAADPAEPMALTKIMQGDAGRFRGYDQQAHDAALLLAQAAHRKDGAAAIAEFAKVQTACLGCHQNFRKPFQARFHVQPE